MGGEVKKLEGAKFVVETEEGAKLLALPDGTVLLVSPNEEPRIIDGDKVRKLFRVTTDDGR